RVPRLAPSDGSALALHDALPIFLGEAVEDDVGRHGGPSRSHRSSDPSVRYGCNGPEAGPETRGSVAAPVLELKALAVLDPEDPRDRKSTRLNSSHVKISYAVFCS